MYKKSQVLCDDCGEIIDDGVRKNTYNKIFGDKGDYCRKCAMKHTLISEHEMLCPDCHGTKVIMGIFPVWADNVPRSQKKPYCFLPCDRCKQEGKVPKEMVQWQREGHKLGDFRRDKRITLRSAAKRLGMNGIKLSEMERGIIKPDTRVYQDL